MRKIVIPLCVALVIAIVVCITTYFDSNNGLPAAATMADQVEKLTAEKKELQQEIYILQGRRDALDTAGAEREQIIRTQLGRIHSDEVLIDLSGANKK